jgi:hypothetical protein
MPLNPAGKPVSGDFDAQILLQRHFYTAGIAVCIELATMNIAMEKFLKLAIWPISVCVTVILLAVFFYTPVTDFLGKTAQIKAPGGVELNKALALPPPPANPSTAAPVVNVVQNNNPGTTEAVTAGLQRLSDVKDDLERTKQSSDFWKGKTFEWVFFYFSNSYPVALNVLSWLAENQTNIVSASAYYTNWSQVMPDQSHQYSVLVTLQQVGFIEPAGNNLRITPLGIEFLKRFRLKPYPHG